MYLTLSFVLIYDKYFQIGDLLRNLPWSLCCEPNELLLSMVAYRLKFFTFLPSFIRLLIHIIQNLKNLTLFKK